MLLPAILASLVLAAPPADIPIATPPWLTQDLAVVDKAMASVESGRKLVALSSEVKVGPRLIDAAGSPVVYLREKKTIGVDLGRAEGLTALEFELALARARARAAYDPGVRLVEAEQAAEQAVLEYALERSQSPGSFGDTIKRALRKAAKRGAQPPRLAERDPERAVELLRKFADDPEEFYWTIEHEVVADPDVVRMPELESFLWANSERVDSAACPPPGRYCKLSGRLVSPALVLAARATLASGGLDRLREKLGAFQADGARELQGRLLAWFRKI